MCYLEGTEIAPAVERLSSWAAFPRVPGLIYLPQPGCPYPVLLWGEGHLETRIEDAMFFLCMFVRMRVCAWEWAP